MKSTNSRFKNNRQGSSRKPRKLSSQVELDWTLEERMRGALIQRPPCDRLLLVTSASTTYSNIYDPGSADGRCPPPSHSCGVLWSGGGLLPASRSRWCGPGLGLLVVVPPFPPCGMAWVRAILRWLPPRLWVCFAHPYDDNDGEGGDDDHHLHD